MHCVSASPENTVVTCHCCHRGAAQSAPDWQNRYLVDRSRMIYRRMTWSRCAVSICHAANGLTYVWPSRTHSRADQGLHYVIFGNVCVSTSKYETMRIHLKCADSLVYTRETKASPISSYLCSYTTWENKKTHFRINQQLVFPTIRHSLHLFSLYKWKFSLCSKCTKCPQHARTRKARSRFLRSPTVQQCFATVRSIVIVDEWRENALNLHFYFPGNVEIQAR